jgi:hypothetical protein
VLAAIQNPNLFRDMSKATELTSIIGSLSALAGQMGQAASTMTGQAAQQALQAATEASKAAAGMAQSLMSEASAHTGGAPTNITSQGAALNEARELDKANAGTGAGSSTGTPTSAGAGAPAGGGLTSSSTADDIVRKAAGVPARSGASRTRTLNVRLTFLSAYGAPIPFNVLAGVPKTFQLFVEQDLRSVFDDTPGSAEAGMQQMNKLVDPHFTFSLPRWSASNAALTIQLDFGNEVFKGTIDPVDIDPTASSMIIIAKFASRGQTVTRARSASRTQTLANLLQEKFGVAATVAKKIADLADFGFSASFESTASTTDTDATTGTVGTTVAETLQIPTGVLDLGTPQFR